MWDNFLEKIVDILGLVLTDSETEKLLQKLPKNGVTTIMKNYSNENMVKLARDSELKLCRHNGSCQYNCFRGTTRTFIAAYLVKFLIAILTGGLKKKSNLLVKSGGKDTFRFAFFLATFVGGFKAIHCFLKNFRKKEDNWNAFIAGSLAGTAMLLDEKSRRTSIALYISTRALEFVYVYLMRRKYVPNIPHGDALIMALSSAQICFAAIKEPETLTKSYYHFLLEHGGFTKYGDCHRNYVQDIGELIKEKEVDISPYKHILEKFPLPFNELNKSPTTVKIHAMSHPTTDSCVVGNSKFFMESIPRSLSLYVPLNIVMTLIFKNKLLMKDPLEFVKRIAFSSARSSLFLSLYCTTVWTIPCLFRNLLQKDITFAYIINGFFSGLMVLVELKSRRLELAMYCAPRALESLWNCLVKWGYLKNIKNGEVIYFSLAMGALMTIFQNEPENLNSAYRTIMTRFFGNN